MFYLYGNSMYVSHIAISWLSKKSAGIRIHQLYHCRGVRPTHKDCPGYVTKQSYGEAHVILEFRGMQSSPSLPSLPGPLWSRVVASDRDLSMDEMELYV